MDAVFRAASDSYIAETLRENSGKVAVLNKSYSVNAFSRGLC